MFQATIDDIDRVMAMYHKWVQCPVIDGIEPASAVRDHPEFADICRHLSRLADVYRSFGSEASAVLVERDVRLMAELPFTWQAVGSTLVDANSVFQTDAQRWAFLVLSNEDAARFANPAPFGPSVAAKFPCATEDVREAAKCLSLERYGASVCHLMRVAERALKSLYVALKVQKTAKTWGNHLENIRASLPSDRRNYTELHAFAVTICGYMESVKNVRDGCVMHVDDPLPTKGVAMDLYEHVRRFMEHVATKLDENGVFTP